ncbi:MAG TPA: DUF1611 domain-containing protein [Polyangia bacterium]|jgi:1,4-alpha-glucan branching enzyme|nr:DUF1611 domain-containing protein [Polyangia bacterium]
MSTSSLVLILNTHMPHVLGQGSLFDQPESWLFEALTETYIPLFRLLSHWEPRRFSGTLVLSFTPCLVHQLLACKERYLGYLRLLERIAHHEMERTASLEAYNRFEKREQRLSDEDLHRLQRSARFYLQRVEDSIAFVEENNLGETLRSFARAQTPGIELWTSSPHHNYLPFFTADTAERFIARGVEEFQQVFGRAPDGFWLPECAFYPGLEPLLRRQGIHRIALSLPSIDVSEPPGASGIYRMEDLDVLVNDHRLSMHLWQSPEKTLPAHPSYREFFRDMGFDVVPEYFERLGIELPARRRGKCWTGIKYHAISGTDVPLGDKRIYDIEAARLQAQHHVATFSDLLERHRHLAHDHQTFVLAFDTELFGHWWHEGVWWLAELLQPEPALAATEHVTLRGAALAPAEPPQLPKLYYSTWGKDFYSEHWLTHNNCWMYALVKLVEANLPGPADADVWRRFERLSGSDLLFQYVDPSQQALVGDLFVTLFTDLIGRLTLTTPELLTAFPVDPFKCLLVHVTPNAAASPPQFHLRMVAPQEREGRRREALLEPEVRTVAGYHVYFQYFLVRPELDYQLRVDGVAHPFYFRMPDFGIPRLITGDLKIRSKYDLEKLTLKLDEIWERIDLPVVEAPVRQSRHVHTREALQSILGGRSAAVFKYNKEGYALVRFRDLALAPPAVVFDDTIAADDAASYLHAPGTSIPVTRDLEDIERRAFDALILTSSLNFPSEIEYVRRLVREAVRRQIPVLSLYDDVLCYDFLDEGADTTHFYRVAFPEPDTAVVAPPARYQASNLLGVFGTDTVQGKFTTQIYLREALRRHLRVKHHATEPTGILLGADTAGARMLKADAAQRLAFDRRLMLGLVESCDLVVTGGQNGLLYIPPGGERAGNPSTFIYETFLPHLIVLTVSVETEPAEVQRTIEYLRELAARHEVPCKIVGLAMMGGRKLHGSRWTETYFIGVQDEVLEAARRRLEQETGLAVHAIPESVEALAQAVLRHLRDP